MAKRKATKGNSAKAGYKISPKRELELKKAVRNYNRRLERQMKKTEPKLQAALPKKISFAELRKSITSSKDVSAQIKRLSKYSAKTGGFEIKEFAGRLITAAELEEYRLAARRESARRRKIKARFMEEQEKQGRFRTAQFQEIEPISPEDIARMKPEQQQALLQAPYKTEYVDPRAVQWQQNYIAHIRQALDLARVMGYLTDDIERAGNEIISIVSKLPTNTFVIASYSNPELDIRMIGSPPDVELLRESIEYILAVWRRYE